jgi:hypothetical protein
MQVGQLEAGALPRFLRLRGPITPGTRPFRVSSSNRCPSSISGELPPIVAKDSSPLSSTFVTAIPISSM